MKTPQESSLESTRRAFLSRAGLGLGGIALAQALNGNLFAAPRAQGALALPHFAPKAKRVIFLFMSGGPSQHELFDHKPLLRERQGQELPPSVRGSQRITGMTSQQSSFPMVGSPFGFQRHGKEGVELSQLIPHMGSIIDDVTLIRSMYTEPINHDPAVTFLLSGNQQPGRPVMGAWVAYGLGSENKDLPEYVVMLSGSGGQPLLTRYWHNGFLPGRFQGVQFRGTGDPVLYVRDPEGIAPATRRRLLDGIAKLNEVSLAAVGDPEIATRISAYEMAWRMQTSVPELTDLSKEPKEVLELYGADPAVPSFANNCLLARRLAERGVRFIQLYHRDWDHHDALPGNLRKLCAECDRPSAALVKDLKRLGLLDDTLVIWGGEFGRTAYSQGPITAESFGRDHHPRCWSMWMAGGGIQRGLVIGKTDEFGYNLLEDPVHVHDFQATVLHCLGVDHEKLTYRFQGRDYRLTDVAGKVVKSILA